MNNTLLGLYNNDKLIGYFHNNKEIEEYIKLKAKLNKDITNYNIKKVKFTV